MLNSLLSIKLQYDISTLGYPVQVYIYIQTNLYIKAETNLYIQEQIFLHIQAQIEIFLYISELKVSKGLSSPTSLLAACNQLGECKSFEVKNKILFLLLTF